MSFSESRKLPSQLVRSRKWEVLIVPMLWKPMNDTSQQQQQFQQIPVVIQGRL